MPMLLGTPAPAPFASPAGQQCISCIAIRCSRNDINGCGRNDINGCDNTLTPCCDINGCGRNDTVL